MVKWKRIYITWEHDSCPLVDVIKKGWITYSSMYVRARKVEWLSMKNRVPTGRGEFRPVETQPVAFEAGSPRIHSWEGVTLIGYIPGNWKNVLIFPRIVFIWVFHLT